MFSKPQLDIGGNVRALKQMLDHPLIFRDSIRELDKPQNVYKTIIKVNKSWMNSVVPIFEIEIIFTFFICEGANQTEIIESSVKTNSSQRNTGHSAGQKNS